MCILAVSISNAIKDNRIKAASYLQLSRMLAPREKLIVPHAHESKKLSRRDLLFLAQESDPELSEVYHDLSYVIDYGENIVLGGSFMNHRALMEKWLTLTSEKFSSPDSSRKQFDVVDISHPALSSILQRILRRLSSVSSETNMLKHAALLIFHAAIRAPNGVSCVLEEVGEEVCAMRRDLSTAHSVCSLAATDDMYVKIDRRRFRDEHLDRVLCRADRMTKSVADGQISALRGHVYGCLALSELGNSMSLQEEADLYSTLSTMRVDSSLTKPMPVAVDCAEIVGNSCPFLSECEAEWNRYVMGCIRVISTDATSVEWFDHVCLLAAARLMRKQGYRQEANALSYAFVNYPGGLMNDMSTDSLGKSLYLGVDAAIEDILCARGQKASTDNVVGINPENFTDVRDVKPVYIPPTFACANEEWIFNKAQLDDEQLEKVSALDDLMGYVGLEEVKKEVLQMYLRYQDMLQAGTWTGELPNFQLIGNPGTGKTEIGRLIARLLMDVGIRPAGSTLSNGSGPFQASQGPNDTAISAQLSDVQLRAAELEVRCAEEECSTLDDALIVCKDAIQSLSNIKIIDTAIKQDASRQALDLIQSGIRSKCDAVEKRLEAAKARKALAQETLSTLKTDQTTGKAIGGGDGGEGMQMVRYVEVSGGELTRGGVKALDAIVTPLLQASPPGGVVFIDDAGQLDADKGTDIVHRLLKLAEEHRTELTFMIAGYKASLERLMKIDAGLYGRFSKRLVFNDYSGLELKLIFEKMVQKSPGDLQLEKESLADVIGRRLARSSNREGFANARAVRDLLNDIKNRNFSRRKEAEYLTGEKTIVGHNILTTQDVLGKRPDPATSPTYRALVNMVGLKQVKESVRSLLLRLQAIWDADARCQTPPQVPFLNRVFVGSPGTGKTTVAKIYANILGEAGFLSKGEVLTTSPSDYLGLNSGETMKKTKAIMERAVGNVLVIDEAFGLKGDTDSHRSAVDTLVAYSPTEAGADMCIILCGYKGEINDMLDNMNPGMKGRFPDLCTVEFESYNEHELREISMLKANAKHLKISYRVMSAMAAQLAGESKLTTFRNGGAVEVLLDKMQSCAEKRGHPNTVDMCDLLEATREDFRDDGIPLHPVIVDQLDKIEASRAYSLQMDLPIRDIQHMLFVGEAGTGKTTAAQKMAIEMKRRGLLPTSKLRVHNAENLVAGFANQTAGKVQKLVDDALGGVLFIDEAHRLAGGDAVAGEAKKEAIGVIMQALVGADYRNKILIIFAGYKHEINKLLDTDEGLRRRFGVTVEFNRMELDDAIRTFRVRLQSQNFYIVAEAEETIRQMFEELLTRSTWSNLADIRTMEEEIHNIRAQAFYRSRANATSDEEKSALDGLQQRWMRDATYELYHTFTVNDILALWDHMNTLRPDRSELAASRAGEKSKKSKSVGLPVAGAALGARAECLVGDLKIERDEVHGLTADREDEDDDDDEEEESGDDCCSHITHFGSNYSGTNKMPLQLQQLHAVFKSVMGPESEDIEALLQKDLTEEDSEKILNIFGLDSLGMLEESKQDVIKQKLQECSVQLKAGAERIENAEADRLRVNREISTAKGELELMLALWSNADQAERERLSLQKDILDRRLQQLNMDAKNQEKVLQLSRELQRISKCPNNYGWVKEPTGYRCEGGQHFVTASQVKHLL